MQTSNLFLPGCINKVAKHSKKRIEKSFSKLVTKKQHQSEATIEKIVEESKTA